MALHTTGHRNLALYDGSWIDYATHSDADPAGLPIATGPAAEGKKRLH
jgi:3-mercaptopyruvate sulfurtransferase SseA